ncbi:MAG: hypothetical protein JW863_16300 [Chitinispirillaceae bacterium]|nr:hypothetical protein [Chitinispirillaceae bacterium]
MKRSADFIIIPVFIVIAVISIRILVSTYAAPFPQSETLYLGGPQWGSPNSFNPLADWPAFPVSGKQEKMPC